MDDLKVPVSSPSNPPEVDSFKPEKLIVKGDDLSGPRVKMWYQNRFVPFMALALLLGGIAITRSGALTQQFNVSRASTNLVTLSLNTGYRTRRVQRDQVIPVNVLIGTNGQQASAANITLNYDSTFFDLSEGDINLTVQNTLLNQILSGPTVASGVSSITIGSACTQPQGSSTTTCTTVIGSLPLVTFRFKVKSTGIISGTTGNIKISDTSQVAVLGSVSNVLNTSSGSILKGITFTLK